MSKFPLDLSTDIAWEEWGRRDPYFGVITDSKYRRAVLTPQAKKEFLESGEQHVDYVMRVVRRYINPNFEPTAVLDFGCGVGRTLIPFASIATEVVGLDVSPSMLEEARRNCDEHKLTNVRLLRSEDSFSSLAGTFDLIHSSIVFQHIPRDRGREILRRLLMHLAPGGAGALHFLYSKSLYSETHGVAPPVQETHSPKTAPSPRSSDIDPEIQMNPYQMNEIQFLLQRRGVARFHAEFTDHGGELGIFIFFQVG